MSNNTHEIFYTKPLSEKGVRIPLYTPEGEKTKEWVEVLGTDADKF